MSLISLNTIKLCFKTLGSSPMKSQIRTTFVLKRRHNVMLSKLKDTMYKRLKTKHFIYDFVEYENIVKQEKMPILLTSYVEGLGDCGDIVQVKPFYARNSLLLPDLAVYPSEENLKKYAKAIEASKLKEQKTYSSPFASLIMKMISKKCYSILVSDSVPWTIEPWRIRVSLRKLNIIAPEDTIRLPEPLITGPDMSIDDKEFVAYVTINKTEEVPIRCRIHHTGIERNEKWYLEEAETIFPEQKTIIDKIPRPDSVKILALKNNIS